MYPIDWMIQAYMQHTARKIICGVWTQIMTYRTHHMIVAQYVFHDRIAERMYAHSCRTRIDKW